MKRVLIVVMISGTLAPSTALPYHVFGAAALLGGAPFRLEASQP